MPGPIHMESLYDKENTPARKRLIRRSVGDLSIYDFEYDENDAAEKKINKRKYKERNVLKLKRSFQHNKKNTKASSPTIKNTVVVEHKTSSDAQVSTDSVVTTTGKDKNVGAVGEFRISSNDEYFGFSDHSSNSSPTREVTVPELNGSIQAPVYSSSPISSNDKYFRFGDYSSNSSLIHEVINTSPELDKFIQSPVYTSSPMVKCVLSLLRQTPEVKTNLGIRQIQSDESVNITESSSIFVDSEMSQSTYFPNSEMISLPETSTINEIDSTTPGSPICEMQEQRRSYSNLRPRKLMRFVEPYESRWSADEDTEQTPEETNINMISNNRNNKKRKQNVASKKEVEFLKLAESINSKFKQIEQFQLVVE